MNSTELSQAIASAIAPRRLLTHPFYVRWQEGRLRRDELGAYAGQYRHFEAMLPGFLGAAITAAAGAPLATAMLARNLADEAGGAVTHLDLFEGFAAAVDAPASAAPEPATRRLLETYGELVATSAGHAVAALVAYETQAPEIAATKAEGLRRLYGVDPSGTAFWDVHATADVAHAAWALEALEALEIEAGAAGDAAGRAGRAWWEFLDEREAAAPARP